MPEWFKEYGLQEFELNGSGLDAELPRFLEAMKQEDPELGTVLETHMSILIGIRTDSERKAARGAFNKAVKADLLTLLSQNE